MRPDPCGHASLLVACVAKCSTVAALTYGDSTAARVASKPANTFMSTPLSCAAIVSASCAVAARRGVGTYGCDFDDALDGGTRVSIGENTGSAKIATRARSVRRAAAPARASASASRVVI